MILIADRGKALTAHLGENEYGGLNVKDLYHAFAGGYVFTMDDDSEYLVATDDEADDILSREIEEYVADSTDMVNLERFPFPNDHEREIALQLQQGKEWARLREILDGYHRERFDKEKRTGRGYLIAKYDGIEHVQGDFYIYRMQ